MWVIIQSDGDADYTTVYGPFTSIAEANSTCPTDDEDYTYRVEPIRNISQLS
jgi:hypothetical protein